VLFGHQRIDSEGHSPRQGGIEQMTGKVTKAWAVFGPNDCIEQCEGPAISKEEAISKFITSEQLEYIGPETAMKFWVIQEYEKRGYTVRPITITEGH
jgi:hypothetical protein